MVTKEQALAESHFHYAAQCQVTIGVRGGKQTHAERWRRSGKTQTWKTKPERFRLPIKYGLYQSMYLTELNARQFHVASECPIEELRGF